MKIKSGFMLRSIAGKPVVVSVGKRTLDFNGVVYLNDSGAYLWKKLEQDTSEEDLVASVLRDYTDVDEAFARACVSDFVNTIREAGCLDE